MDSRERVLLALNFEEPDRIPIDFWGSAGFFKMLKRERGMGREEFFTLAGVDFRYIAGPTYIGPPLHDNRDIWGVPRKRVSVATANGEEIYQEVIAPPLADAGNEGEIEDYTYWPSPDWFDYADIRRQCQEVKAKGKIVVFMGDRLNRCAQLKPAMYLRGVERILLDILTEPGIARALFRRISDFYAEYLTRILESAQGDLDIVLTGDDFGTQKSLLISPQSWIDFLGEGFALYNRIIASGGAISMHHTCGNVGAIIPLMLERGLKILQSLQPEAMAADYSGIKERYGGRLSLHGGISVQQLLPKGKAREIQAEVESITAILKPGGGYIISTAHNVQADCALRNIDALLKSYRRFCPYGP